MSTEPEYVEPPSQYRHLITWWKYSVVFSWTHVSVFLWYNNSTFHCMYVFDLPLWYLSCPNIVVVVVFCCSEGKQWQSQPPSSCRILCDQLFFIVHWQKKYKYKTRYTRRPPTCPFTDLYKKENKKANNDEISLKVVEMCLQKADTLGQSQYMCMNVPLVWVYIIYNWEILPYCVPANSFFSYDRKVSNQCILYR